MSFFFARYLRPIISQITAASPYNAYNLPFIDFQRNKMMYRALLHSYFHKRMKIYLYKRSRLYGKIHTIQATFHILQKQKE